MFVWIKWDPPVPVSVSTKMAIVDARQGDAAFAKPPSCSLWPLSPAFSYSEQASYSFTEEIGHYTGADSSLPQNKQAFEFQVTSSGLFFERAKMFGKTKFVLSLCSKVPKVYIHDSESTLTNQAHRANGNCPLLA